MSDAAEPTDSKLRTRQRLLEQAAKILDESGQDAITMRAVAAKVGVSAMASYKHFPDKQSLLVALAASDLERMGAAMDAVADDLRPKERLTKILVAYVHYGVSYPARYKLIFGREISAANDISFNKMAMAVFKRIETAVADYLQQIGFEEPTSSTAGVMLACVHGAIDLHSQGHVSTVKGLGDPAALVRTMLSLLPAAP